MSNQQIREMYNQEIIELFSQYKPILQRIHQDKQSINQELIKEISDKRDTIKSKYQEETAWYAKPFIWARQCYKYKLDLNDPYKITECFTDPNPKFEDLIKTKSPEEILYSSFKTSGKDLGLEDNGFDLILKLWEKMSTHAELEHIYPENITSNAHDCMYSHLSENDDIISSYTQCYNEFDLGSDYLFSL